MLKNQKIDSSKGKLQHLAFTRLSYSERSSFSLIIYFNNISAFIESHPSRSFELTAFEVVVCIVNPALLLKNCRWYIGEIYGAKTNIVYFHMFL